MQSLNAVSDESHIRVHAGVPAWPLLALRDAIEPLRAGADLPIEPVCGGALCIYVCLRVSVCVCAGADVWSCSCG